MKTKLISSLIACFFVIFCSCDRKQDSQARSIFTEDAISQFPAGKTLDSFIQHFDLEAEEFHPHPNLEHGVLQGSYQLPEGDLMISATLSKEGVMVLDDTPWIITKAEQVAASDR